MIAFRLTVGFESNKELLLWPLNKFVYVLGTAFPNDLFSLVSVRVYADNSKPVIE